MQESREAYGKTGCASCTKRTISLEVSGFRTRTHLLQRDFIFLNLFEVHTFCVFKMHHWKAHHKILTISDFIWYSSCIYLFFWASWPWNWKALQMKKLDALRVQNGQSLSKYQGFERELISYKEISFFWTYLKSILFVCSKCTIERHITKF